MGCVFSCLTGRSPKPRPKVRDSKLTTTTRDTDETMLATQNADGRTSILMSGRTHEDPLGSNPVPRQRPRGKATDINLLPSADDERWKRSGGVFVLEEEAESSGAGSSRRTTQVYRSFDGRKIAIDEWVMSTVPGEPPRHADEPPKSDEEPPQHSDEPSQHHEVSEVTIA